MARAEMKAWCIFHDVPNYQNSGDVERERTLVEDALERAGVRYKIYRISSADNPGSTEYAGHGVIYVYGVGTDLKKTVEQVINTIKEGVE